VKLKEYLAVARPVVSTPFDELKRYAGLVSVAADADEFAGKIREALETPVDKAMMRRRVENETWAEKSAAVIEDLQGAGVEFRKVMIEPEPTTTSAEKTDQTKALRPALASLSGDSAERHGAGVQPVATSRGYWRPRHIVGACLLAFLGWWVTSDAWSDIFRLAAKDEESSHIWLVLPIAAWLVWVRKEQLFLSRRSGTIAGPLLVGLGWLLFSVGDSQLFQSFWHLGAIMITVGCALAVLGSNVLWRFWPAFAVLVFLIPVPGIVRHQIASPMQTITAELTALVLQTVGQPVTLSGKVLVLNDVPVGIAEACNGVRMVFALVLVCFLYAFSTELSTRTRVLIMLASPIVAVAVNVARLVPTVCLYGYADEKTATLFHDVSGWAMMPIALFGMIGVGSLFRWAFRPDPETQHQLPSVPEPSVAGRT
jgi:exosortase